MKNDIIEQYRNRLSLPYNFCSRISHSLRSPLSGILLNTQMMEQELPNDSPLFVYIHDILEGVLAIEGTLSCMLEFAAPAQPMPQRLLLFDLVDEVLREFRDSLQKNLIRISIEPSTDLPASYADPDQVRTILRHLVRNAVQAMPFGGELRIRGHKRLVPGDQGNGEIRTEVEVGDTGQGIPGEIIERVFDPFFTTGKKKNGLGLSIVFKLCDLNRIQLFLDSSEHAGTRFRLLFRPVPGLTDKQIGNGEAEGVQE